MKRLVVAAVVLGLVAAALAVGAGRGTRGAVQARGSDRLIRPTPESVRVNFLVDLRLPRTHQLDRFLGALDDPASPSYRRFIGPRTFGRRFGLSLSTIASVRARLEREGFTVSAAAPGRTSLTVSGTAQQLRRAFRVRLGDYEDRSGRRFRSALSDAVVPRELARAVVGIAGLNTHPPASAAIPAQEGFKPADLARAYDIKRLWDQGIRGEGQTIAVYSTATFNDGDLKAFDDASGIAGPGACTPQLTTGCVESVPVGGGVGNATHAEDALDVEVIHGIAPAAHVLNFEAPVRGAHTFVEYNHSFVGSLSAVVDAVIADGRAKILNISYGVSDVERLGNERWLSPVDRDAMEKAFAKARSAGINVFVASGDQGAYDCQAFDVKVHQICPAWPDSPSIITVGGTLLDIRKDGSYLEESGWEDFLSGWGSGGGLNPHDKRPAWQSKSVPGVQNRFSNGNRQMPDVSASAASGSGYYVVYNGRSSPIGGTSGSSPFWAASTALIQEYVQHQGGGKLPFMSPLLYKLAAGSQPNLFHDVVRGGNRYYPATPGWDYATGLGSPFVFNLARAVSAELKRH